MPVSESRRKANNKWDSANLKRLSVALQVQLYNDMVAHVQESKETVNGFIRQSITEKLDKEKQGASDQQ